MKRAAFVLRHPRRLVAFGFGTGLAPSAPGTFGTLVGIPLFLLAAGLPPLLYVGVTAAAFAAGIWICGETARDLNSPDDGGIVWDEVVGFMVTMIAVEPSIASVVAGFTLFRVFDIWKPWPISLADRRVHGGFGIMLDDLLAGLVACAILHAGLWLIS